MVPTATIRPPEFRLRLSAEAVAGAKVRRAFGVEGVVLDVVGLDRSEGADADVQGEVEAVDAPGVEAVGTRSR